jgi:hypothetical protein
LAGTSTTYSRSKSGAAAGMLQERKSTKGHVPGGSDQFSRCLHTSAAAMATRPVAVTASGQP